MNPAFDRLMILSLIILTYVDASLSFQFIGTSLFVIMLIMFNRYGYILDEYDYFPDDVTFVDEKKAYR
jgi:hypothetical protein|tara:strand:- start:39 stop:242 length:204 start_codon:yes stop_codon:yes gene_type:complete